MELTPAQAEKEWTSGKFRPSYHLLGEDPAAKSTWIGRLKALLNPNPFNYGEYASDADPRDVVSAALTPPMLAARRLLVWKTQKLSMEARKRLAEYLSDPLASTTVVLCTEDRKADPKDLLIGAVAALGGLITFRPLREDEAVAGLRQAASDAGATLPADAAELLVEEAGLQWGVLRAELDKLLLFTKGRTEIGRDDVVSCLGYRQASNPFDFPRLLEKRDEPLCLRQLHRLIEDGVEPLRLLYQTSATLNKLLKAKRMRSCGLPETQIFRELRLNSYYDRDYLRRAAAWNEACLIAGLRACIELEARLKSRAWLEPAIELERLAASLCGRGRPAEAGA